MSEGKVEKKIRKENGRSKIDGKRMGVRRPKDVLINILWKVSLKRTCQFDKNYKIDWERKQRSQWRKKLEYKTVMMNRMRVSVAEASIGWMERSKMSKIL